MAPSPQEMNPRGFCIEPKMSIEEIIDGIKIKPQNFEDLEYAVLTSTGITIPEEKVETLRLNEFKWLPMDYEKTLSIMGITDDESLKNEISPIITVFEGRNNKNIICLQIININKERNQIVYQTLRKIHI